VKIVTCVAMALRSGILQIKCNVEMNRVIMMVNHASLMLLAANVAAVEPILVMEQFAVVHAYRGVKSVHSLGVVMVAAHMMRTTLQCGPLHIGMQQWDQWYVVLIMKSVGRMVQIVFQIITATNAVILVRYMITSVVENALLVELHATTLVVAPIVVEQGSMIQCLANFFVLTMTTI
jgi:hypothetical protein